MILSWWKYHDTIMIYIIDIGYIIAQWIKIIASTININDQMWSQTDPEFVRVLLGGYNLQLQKGAKKNLRRPTGLGWYYKCSFREMYLRHHVAESLKDGRISWIKMQEHTTSTRHIGTDKRKMEWARSRGRSWQTEVGKGRENAVNVTVSVHFVHSKSLSRLTLVYSWRQRRCWHHTRCYSSVPLDT